MKICVALAIVLGLAACSKKVDNADLAKKLTDQVNDQLTSHNIKVKVKGVDCPSGQSMKEGTKFDCTIHFDNGKDVTSHVEVGKDRQAKFDTDAQQLAAALGQP